MKTSVSGQRGSLQNVGPLRSAMFLTSHKPALRNASHTSSTLAEHRGGEINLLVQGAEDIYNKSCDSNASVPKPRPASLQACLENGDAAFSFTSTMTAALRPLQL